MLDQIARHGMMDLDASRPRVICTSMTTTRWKTSVLPWVRPLQKPLGDKKGILRYGHAYVPLDEALSRVVIDFFRSSRHGISRALHPLGVGGFDVDLFMEFFQGFVNHAKVTLHVDNLRGDNSHHQVETVFKAFGRALRMALTADPRMAGVTPSTKGVL